MLGDDMSLAMRLIVALVIILALIGFVMLILKRFGVGGMGKFSSNGRQPRLAVMDMAHLDSRRKLVIVRRDAVEHLIMIGGPNDIVIEQGIVRGVALPAQNELSAKAQKNTVRVAPSFTAPPPAEEAKVDSEFQNALTSLDPPVR